MDIQPINENEEFYFCQIISENGPRIADLFANTKNPLNRTRENKKPIKGGHNARTNKTSSRHHVFQ